MDRDDDVRALGEAATGAAKLEDGTVAATGVPSTSATRAAARPSSGATRYRLDQVIGRGGMGEVVSARDEQLGRSVAVKRIRARGASSEAVARFVREAQIQGRLEHPAIAPVHELWEDADGQPCFAMKQLAGVTLADVIAQLAAGAPQIAQKFPRQRLLRAFVDVCLAIEFAHTRGVVHRDLKPGNIMLGDFGEVYVLDWGIARVDDEVSPAGGGAVPADGGTAAGAMMGTPGYMPPEQIRGETDLDERADIYALGSMLFEILALEPLHPRGGTAIDSTLEGVDARPSQRARAHDVPPELDVACTRATMIDRQKRFATARELGEVVQRFLDGDRDLALRKQLARGERELAREAFARGNGTAARRDAIRAAGRALALDPTQREPAELVGRLMLEPPAETPPEVEDELEGHDRTEIELHWRRASVGMLLYFVLFPFLYWVGLRDAWYQVAGFSITALTILSMRHAARHPTLAAVFGSLVAGALMHGLIARITGPFLVAPGLVLITALTYAMHPRVGRGWVVAGLSIAAVMTPWALELAGVLSRTTVVEGNSIVMHAATDRLDPTATLLGMTLFVIVLVALGTSVLHGMANDRRALRRTLQVQSWTLRQLMPAG